MKMETVTPLHNFPLGRTRSIDELREMLRTVFVKPRAALLTTRAPIDASLNECRQFHRLRLGFARYRAPICLQFPPTDCFLTYVPVRGKGEIITATKILPMAPGLVATISPGIAYQVIYDSDYEFLALKIEAKALISKLEEMTDATIDKPLRLDPRPEIQPAAQMLRNYVPQLAKTLTNADQNALPAWWLAETEHLLMAMVLCSHRHTYSHLLTGIGPSAMPSQVREAEAYIESHWHDQITLETLAEATGVSAFSLFRAFKTSRGYSPLEFAARVRAERSILR